MTKIFRLFICITICVSIFSLQAISQSYDNSTDPEAASLLSSGSVVSPGLEEPIDPDTYKIVVGDRFTLIIRREFQEPNLFEIEVLSEGKAVLPYLNEVQAEGLTLSQFAKKVKQSYIAVFPEFEVNILLSDLGQFLVNVVGGVNSPGVITVNSATRLSAAIAGAGGFKDYGSARNIQIQNGNETAAYDLFTYNQFGKMDQNPYMQPRTIVIVPPKFGEVEIIGEVNEPAKYEILEGETILNLLDFSKGLTTFADKNDVLAKRVVLSPEGKTKFEKKVISLTAVFAGKEKPLALQGGDEITIYPFAQDKIGTVEIRGNIQEPGFYDLFDGMTVTDLIRAGGGFLKFMGKTKAILLTKENGGDLHKREIDLSGYPDIGNIDLRPGARLYIFNPESQMGYVSVEGRMVMSPGFFPYYPGITAYEAINMAGGIAYQDINEMKNSPAENAKNDMENIDAESGVISLRNSFIMRSNPNASGSDGPADKYIALRLDELFYKQDISYDVRLEIGDRIIVGMRKDDFVMVAGAVLKPGEVSFVANMPAHYYATQAGMRQDAEMESMVVLRNGKEVIKDPNAIVLPGDVVTVKEKKDSRNRTAISKISQVISSIYMIQTMIDNAND